MKQVKENTMEWLSCAGIRAIKTFAQTFISMVVVGQTIADINWQNVISVSLVAALVSLMTSVAGLPEVGERE